MGLGRPLERAVVNGCPNRRYDAGIEVISTTVYSIVNTSGGIEEWVAEDKHHFCIR